MTTSTGGYTPFLTPADIYHQIREGKGPGSLNNAQFNIKMELTEETDRAKLIASLADLITTGWQGKASAAAHGAALPLRDHVLENADKLDQVQDLLSRQSGSFEQAYNSVRPVPDVPQQSLEEPIPFDVDHAKEVAFYQAVAQHNMDVFRQYDGASEYNETNMPQEFHAGGRDGGDVSVKSADTIEVGAPRGGGEPFDGSPRGAGSGEVSGPGGPGGGFSGGPSPAGYPGASAGPPTGDTGSSGGVTGSSGAVTGSSGGVTGSSGVLPSAGGQAGANDYRPGLGGGSSSGGYSSPLPGVPGAAGPGGVPVGGYSGGGGGGVPRTGGGGGGAAAGPVVRGPGGAVGAGALAAEENAVRRGAAAAAGRGGVGPLGAPMGAGRSKDDEDAEHERKVLIEVDAEETFGSDVLTAPPVIGDDEYED